MTESTTAPLRTEYPFTLPRGYLAPDGTQHCKGIIRLATALDEITPLRDPRVRENQAYLTIAILARVVKLDGVDVDTNVIENLFTGDLAYLQDLYREINGYTPTTQAVTCPNCKQEFQVEVEPLGEA